MRRERRRAIGISRNAGRSIAGERKCREETEKSLVLFSESLQHKHNVVVVTWNPAGPSSSPKIKTTLDGDRESSPSLLSKNRVEKPESSPSRREIYSVTPSIFAPFPSSGFARSNSRNELSGRDLTARIRCLSCSPPAAFSSLMRGARKNSNVRRIRWSYYSCKNHPARSDLRRFFFRRRLA